MTAQLRILQAATDNGWNTYRAAAENGCPTYRYGAPLLFTKPSRPAITVSFSVRESVTLASTARRRVMGPRKAEQVLALLAA